MFPKLPPVGENAFEQGFLNADFSNAVIDTVNLMGTLEIVGPQGATGKVIWSKENVRIDLTQFWGTQREVWSWVSGVLVKYRTPATLA